MHTRNTPETQAEEGEWRSELNAYLHTSIQHGGRCGGQVIHARTVRNLELHFELLPHHHLLLQRFFLAAASFTRWAGVSPRRRARRATGLGLLLLLLLLLLLIMFTLFLHLLVVFLCVLVVLGWKLALLLVAQILLAGSDPIVGLRTLRLLLRRRLLQLLLFRLLQLLFVPLQLLFVPLPLLHLVVCRARIRLTVYGRLVSIRRIVRVQSSGHTH
jgi:hypothetical protein